MSPEALLDEGDRVRRIDAPRCGLGESPRWGNGRWWWVDASAGLVWSGSSDFSDVRRELVTGERISLVLPALNGRVVVARGTDLVTLDPRTHDVTPWAHVELGSGWALNDGSVDEDGCIWVGSVHPEQAPGSGLVHRIAPNGSVITSHTGTQLSNGMVWASRRELLHADSRTRQIMRHRIDAQSGRVVGTSIAWELEKRDRVALPDGMCSDEAGGVWVAMYGAGEAVRFLKGIAVETIKVPTAQTTSVSLGGPDGRDLLLTTAQEGMNEDAITADQNAGALFRARVRVPGSIAPLVQAG